MAGGLRASGMGLGYVIGNFGKIISPRGLALIVGGTNVIKPEASVEAMVPAMFFLAFWAALAAGAFVVLGIETRGRSIKVEGVEGLAGWLLDDWRRKAVAAIGEQGHAQKLSIYRSRSHWFA